MPESIFWENSPYLELDCGTISVVSDLREYRKDVDYKKFVYPVKRTSVNAT